MQLGDLIVWGHPCCVTSSKCLNLSASRFIDLSKKDVFPAVPCSENRMRLEACEKPFHRL